MTETDVSDALDAALRSGEKPTLKTIARITGLAVPTVSRALNDAPDIREQTKVLVRKIAGEVGYIPNRAGVRLRTGRTNVISLVLAAESEVMNHNAKLISAVASEMRGTPYHLNITPFFSSDDVMAPIKYVFETRSADAVIFNQTMPDDPRIAYLMERGFPFATHGRSKWAENHAWADYDNETFGRIAVERLVAKGRQNILLLAPPLSHTYAQLMVAGAREVAMKAGVNMRLANEITSDSSKDQVIEVVRDVLAADPSIDAVICGSMMAALGVVGAAEQRGYVIGQNFDLFSKEALPFLNLFRPGVMAISEDVTRAGRFLARAAMARVTHPSAAPMQDLEIPSWTTSRSTTG